MATTTAEAGGIRKNVRFAEALDGQFEEEARGASRTHFPQMSGDYRPSVGNREGRS
jgi:hypothetical protein